MAKKLNLALARRRNRMRNKLKKVGGLKPRLTVFRSSKNISAQVVDDTQGRTLASASSLEKGLDLRGKLSVETAAKVGELVAQRAKEAGVEAIYFDRSDSVRSSLS